MRIPSVSLLFVDEMHQRTSDESWDSKKNGGVQCHCKTILRILGKIREFYEGFKQNICILKYRLFILSAAEKILDFVDEKLRREGRSSPNELHQFRAKSLQVQETRQ